MPADHFSSSDGRHPGVGVLDVRLRWRDAAWTTTCGCHVLERGAIHAHRATIDRAGGALMRHYGMNNFQVLSLMVRWARQTHSPVHTLARKLVPGIDEADPQPERRHRPLIRWLEGQLRYADP